MILCEERGGIIAPARRCAGRAPGVCVAGAAAIPATYFQDLLDLLECEIDFLIAIVEVRRESNSAPGPEVHENFARDKFRRHFTGVRTIDRHGAAALASLERRIDSPPARFGACDQPLGLLYGFLADCFHADGGNNLKTRAGRRRAPESAAYHSESETNPDAGPRPPREIQMACGPPSNP